MFEDVGEDGRFVEIFLVDSWLEHLRQHERVTNADRVLQESIARFHISGTPKVIHLIAADLARGSADAIRRQLMMDEAPTTLEGRPLSR